MWTINPLDVVVISRSSFAEGHYDVRRVVAFRGFVRCEAEVLYGHGGDAHRATGGG